MKRAFIFGTFNPPTVAHIKMGLAARKALGRDYEIIYVPTSDEYIKSWKKYEEGSVLHGRTRIKLLRNALKPYDRMGVTNVEVDGIVDGRTWNTLDHMGDQDSVLCLGMDNVAGMDKWYNYEELIRTYPLLIFRRGQMPMTEAALKILEKSPAYGVVTLGKEYSGISSTLVREYYINNNMEAIRELVPDNVLRFLEENENVYF